MSRCYSVKNSREMDAILAHTQFVIVDFWATWCPPCRQISPLFEQLSITHTSPGNLVFVKVDVDAVPDIAQKYRVSAMPTFLLFQDGQQISQVRGANPAGVRTLVLHAIQTIQQGQAADSSVDDSNAEDTPTVSGSYTVSSNPTWRMAL